MMVLATMKVLEFRGNCIAFENQDLQAVFAAGLWPFFFAEVLSQCSHPRARDFTGCQLVLRSLLFETSCYCCCHF